MALPREVPMGYMLDLGERVGSKIRRTMFIAGNINEYATATQSLSRWLKARCNSMIY